MIVWLCSRKGLLVLIVWLCVLITKVTQIIKRQSRRWRSQWVGLAVYKILLPHLYHVLIFLVLQILILFIDLGNYQFGLLIVITTYCFLYYRSQIKFIFFLRSFITKYLRIRNWARDNPVDDVIVLIFIIWRICIAISDLFLDFF